MVFQQDDFRVNTAATRNPAQQQASAEVQLLTVPMVIGLGAMDDKARERFLRGRGLVEPAPVDPLREALSWAIKQHFDLTDAQLDDIADEVRARGVTHD